MKSTRLSLVVSVAILVTVILVPNSQAQNEGTFVGAVNYPAGAPTVPSNTGYLIGGVVPTEVHTGDFNGDGKLDVIAAVNCSLGAGGGYGLPNCPASGYTVAVYLSNGDGTFQAPILSASLPPDLRSIVVGDFNGDGKLDVAGASDCLSD